MADSDEREIDPDDEAAAELPDLDVTDESGDAVKGGVPKVED